MLEALPSFPIDAHRHPYTPALQRITPLEKGGLILRENNASRKMGGFSMGRIPTLVALMAKPSPRRIGGVPMLEALLDELLVPRVN